ncbi:MAG: hypothetical protein ACP6IP_01765 [Candidatus Njordarchaeia archaeon]
MEREINFYGRLSYVEKDYRVSVNWEIWDENSNILGHFPISEISRISIIRKNIFSVEETYCGATSWKACKECNLYPDYCGLAIVYIRPVVYRTEIIKFKVGISNDLIRPLSQSAPFAIISYNIIRRDALALERDLSSAFRNIVQNPRGRTVWMDVIESGYWDGLKEYHALMDFLEEMYKRIRRKRISLFRLIKNPILYKPGRKFATKLPKWIKLMDELDIRKTIKRNPAFIVGDVVANRVTLTVLELNGTVLFFEPKEKMIYKVNNIEGEKGFSEMYVREELNLL